jgi:hypothetical protein
MHDFKSIYCSIYALSPLSRGQKSVRERGVGVGVGVGVGLAVGDGTGVCFWVFAVVGPAVVEPQEASTAMARARQNTMTMLFVGLPLRGCKQWMADALDLGYHIEVLPNGKLLDRITIT